MKGRQLILVLPLGLCLGLVLAMGNLVLRVRAQAETVQQPAVAGTAAPTPSQGAPALSAVSGTSTAPSPPISETGPVTSSDTLVGEGDAVTATQAITDTDQPEPGAAITVAQIVSEGLPTEDQIAAPVVESEATTSPAPTALQSGGQILAVDPPPHAMAVPVGTGLVATASASLSPTSITSSTFRAHGVCPGSG